MGVNDPEVSLTVRPARWTPALISSNADASIGDGDSSGTFWIDGHVMHMEQLFKWGTTSTFGTGSLYVSFPPGFGFADVDVAAMSFITPFGFAVGHGDKSLGGVGSTMSVDAVAFVGVVILGIDVAALALIAPGDAIGFAFDLPLVEPAIPE